MSQVNRFPQRALGIVFQVNSYPGCALSIIRPARRGKLLTRPYPDLVWVSYPRFTFLIKKIFHSSTNMPMLKSMVSQKQNGSAQFSSARSGHYRRDAPRKSVEWLKSITEERLFKRNITRRLISSKCYAVDTLY